MTRELPSRISPDAILEAIVEIRFDPGVLPEIFMGKLLSSKVFQGLTPTRLPQADIPMSAREVDPALRAQPIYQLQGEGELVRIGSSMLSLHMVAPYRGWDRFRERAAQIIEGSWSECGRPPLERAGLRYVNALTPEEHGVRGIDDLNLVVSVAGRGLVDVTVSFLSEDQSGTESLVRVASIKHVTGEVPPSATFIVDIDVRTTEEIASWSVMDLVSWLDHAHEIEKSHFFDLLPDKIVQPLRES